MTFKQRIDLASLLAAGSPIPHDLATALARELREYEHAVTDCQGRNTELVEENRRLRAFLNAPPATAKQLAVVAQERLRQDRKWGRAPGAWTEDSAWQKYAVLGEEVGEVGRALLHSDVANLAEELTQVAAIAVAWLESMADGNGAAEWEPAHEQRVRTGKEQP